MPNLVTTIEIFEHILIEEAVRVRYEADLFQENKDQQTRAISLIVTLRREATPPLIVHVTIIEICVSMPLIQNVYRHCLFC